MNWVTVDSAASWYEGTTNGLFPSPDSARTGDFIEELLDAADPFVDFSQYDGDGDGYVDLLAILPSYLVLLNLGWHGAVVVRALRLLRVFRIFKLAQFLTEAAALREALRSSHAKITVFLVTVLILICIVGSAMYLIEGPEHGFHSIPEGIYWAIVTVTTVGYGDISPSTPLGKTFAAFVMVIGYSILIIPGGIISAEWVAHRARTITTQQVNRQ